MKYEGPNSYHSKDMANVKFLLTNKQTGQKLYARNLLMQGHKNDTNKSEFFDMIENIVGKGDG